MTDSIIDDGVTTDIGRFAIVPLWLVKRCNDTPSGSAALSVFIALHHWTDRARPCFPSIGSIAEHAGLSPASVKRGISALERMGALTVTARYVEGTRERTSSSYRMHHADPTSAQIRADRSGQIRPHPSGQIRASNKNKLEREQVEQENTSLLETEPTSRDENSGVSDFDAWWKIHPRKVGRPAAERSWRRLSAADRAAALDGLRAHLEHWRMTGTEQRFIPHPATWLNGRRWEDELGSTWQPARQPHLSPVMQTLRDRMIAAEERDRQRELGQ